MLTCTKPEMVALLGGFICSTSDVRELKRALAVKMAIEGKPYGEIAELLEVYKSFILSRWVEYPALLGRTNSRGLPRGFIPLITRWK